MKILPTILLSSLSLLYGVSTSAADKSYGDATAIVASVVDGDTIKVNIPNWPRIIGEQILIRVYGVDCKELGAGGEDARDFVRSNIKAGAFVVLRNIRRDKYFRLVSDVGFDCGDFSNPDTCDSLSAILIEKKLAVPYFGGTK